MGNRTCDGKLGFRIHALAYAGTIALLLGINLLTGLLLGRLGDRQLDSGPRCPLVVRAARQGGVNN